MDETIEGSGRTPAFNQIPQNTPQSKARARFVLNSLADEALQTFKRHIASVPDMFRGRYERCLTGEAGLADVVKATCAECVGFENTVETVGQCQSWRCPIWLYRPYQE